MLDVARCMVLCCHRCHMLYLSMPTGALGVACLVTSTACCLCMLPRCCGKRSSYTVIENSTSFRHISNEVDASSKHVNDNEIFPLLT